MAKYIISRLRADKEGCVESFLDEFLKERNSCEAVLRATLHQALKSRSNLISEFLVPEYERARNKKDVWTLENLSIIWPDVMTRVTESRCLTIIIDGFDQISSKCQKDFFQCLDSYKTRSKNHRQPDNLRLLLLSREYPSFSHQSIYHCFCTYRMTKKDTEMDISKTVDSRLKEFEMAVGYSDMLRKRLREEIPKGANGMYLWATAMVDDLKYTFATEQDVQERLESLPKGIDELYDSILGRISKRRGDTTAVVKLVLMWVAFRLEKLKANELGFALALSRARRSVNPEEVNDEVMKPFMLDCTETVVSYLCGQLVKFSGRNAELIHRSLYTYLTTKTGELRRDHGKDICIPHHSQWYMNIEETHAAIGNICVAYLGMSYFDNCNKDLEGDTRGVQGRILWEQKVRRRVEKHPFVRYAALTWCRHLREAGASLAFHSSDLDIRGRKVLEDIRTQHAICWTEVWWLINRWPRMPYATHDLEMNEVLVYEFQRAAQKPDNGFTRPTYVSQEEVGPARPRTEQDRMDIDVDETQLPAAPSSRLPNAVGGISWPAHQARLVPPTATLVDAAVYQSANAPIIHVTVNVHPNEPRGARRRLFRLFRT